MQNKNVLIVGASSGIGAAIAQQLAEEGANIYSVSRTAPSVDCVKHYPLDVTDNTLDLDDLPDTLDGLVYCPGSINLKPFRSLKIEAFESDLQVNYLGAIKVIKSALKALKRSEGLSSIVLFSTVAVGTGMPFHASIAGAKGAVEGLTRSLAAEFAPRIRVNCIAPSLTNTPLAHQLLANDDKIEANRNRHPLKQIGQPIDLANAACFLLSDKSKWMTGQVLGIDGGMSSLKA